MKDGREIGGQSGMGQGAGETAYERLFTPWKLGKFEIRNRICVPPLVVFNWGDESGRVSEKSVRHYEALTRGGAGLVIQEATSVSRGGRITCTMLGIWEDGQIEGLSRLARVFHDADMPAILQLSHAGILAEREADRVAPVPYRCVADGAERVGRGLSAEELARLEQDFIDGARRAIQAGYDGVELHASHGYLLSELLNGRMNQRTDAYAASDRLFFLHVMEGIRRIAPPDFLIGVRLGAFEPALEDGLENAAWFESHGADFIDAFIGCDWAMDLEKPDTFPFNESIYGAKRIRERVSVPVFAVSGISTGRGAEEVLKATGADMAVIGRGSLVNENWGNDVRAGRNPGRCQECARCMWKVDADRCPGHLLLEKERAGQTE